MTFSTTVSTRIAAALDELRRRAGIMTEQEAHLAYIGNAQDRIDLELRIRALDHSDRNTSSYPSSNWSL